MDATLKQNLLSKSILIYLLLASSIIYSQNKLNMKDRDYSKGKYILENVEKELSNNNNNVTYADYWNLALGNALIGKEDKVVLEYLKQSKDADNEAFNDICNRLISYYNYDIKNTVFYKLLTDEFVTLFKTSEIELKSNTGKPKKNEVIANSNDKIVAILNSMLIKDQKYRKDYDFLADKNKQKLQSKLDKENREQLEMLFSKYGYCGKSLLGNNKYKNYMCLLVEHGQALSDQKKWLGIILTALKKGELDKNPVRMLFDRIHWQETGKQYFGSHTGIPFESKEEIDRIKKLYDL